MLLIVCLHYEPIMKPKTKNKVGRPKLADKSKQIAISFEAENFAFLSQIQQRVAHGRLSFTATVNLVIAQIRNGKPIEEL